jgi:hypothetical protein
VGVVRASGKSDLFLLWFSVMVNFVGTLCGVPGLFHFFEGECLMWRKTMCVVAMIVLLALAVTPTMAGYHRSFDFNSSWSSDYAPGWENTSYRHGVAPVGKMMEQVAGGIGGSGAVKLIADSAPRSTDFWAIVNPIDVNNDAMRKEYDPWISASYFDEGWESGSQHQAGQIYAVPSWVNPYITPGEDWTDVQFGGRRNAGPNYYFVAAGESSPGWVNTTVARPTGGWTQLKMQLSSTDGKIHFYINGTDVGTSYRNDYVDLADPALATMFTAPLSNWTTKPYAVWDNYEYGSTYVPLPSAALSGLALLASLGLSRRLRQA